ncbi:uncharacterized protein RSE6_05052 [Rhynchosporium secalis]|uniref:FAS1 domain-containing protein n=1 Tax=Rhynchosporium secalis TaxID=38038 RepID=A0A1E1M6V6_RHYSE|nr:uncharacterized protein RSE6_05052 [Rhynchosporium secalis]
MKSSTFLVAFTIEALSTVLAAPVYPSGPDALLSVLSRQPDLSTFSSIIRKTGGPNPNPAFEERFNSALDTRNYTIFAPTNEAMRKIPSAALDLLAQSRSYELLESIVRTHIGEGLYTAANLSSGAETKVTAVEGFPLTVNSTTAGSGKTFKLNDANLNLTDTVASNGRIHTIDRLLTPLSMLFGVSNSSTAPGKGSTKTKTTIAGIVDSDPRLSVLKSQIKAVDPDFMTRLSLSKPGNEKQIYLAPSNDAFARIPVESMAAPSNVGLSRYLLRFGLLSGDLGVVNKMAEGKVQSTSGWNITAKKSGAAYILGNAGVVEKDICADNGCVWIVDKLIDPLIGVMN